MEELSPLTIAKQYSKAKTLLCSYLVLISHYSEKPPWLEVAVKWPVELEKLKELSFWKQGRAPRILFWAGCLLTHHIQRPQS